MISNATRKKLLDSSIDLSQGTFKVALLTRSSHITDPDDFEFLTDAIGGDGSYEYNDLNYSRQTINNVTTTVDSTNDEAMWDGDNVTFPSLGSSQGQTVYAVVIYKEVGGDDTTPGDDPIVRVITDSEDEELPRGTNGSDITFTWDTNGIVRL